MPETSLSHDHFAALRGADSMVLTTYRRNGVAVPTIVWFAESDGVIYLTSGIQAGKIKRIRANPTVEVAPCSYSGSVNGPAIAGHARVLEPQENDLAINALLQKYGERYTQLAAQLDASRTSAGRLYVMITSEPA